MKDPEASAWLDLLTPDVLNAAWRLTVSWYEAGEWYDPSEYLAWKADPWANLEALAADLRGGTYGPAPMPLVPYPKKGDRTRHYTYPSVRDQVAFNLFVVLLGPTLEARFPNVSMGNRLSRERIPLHEGDGGPRAIRGPFSLQSSRIYDSFAAGYGLFRRLLQWKANEGVLRPDERIGKEYFDAEDPTRLPYEDWHFNRAGPLYYVRLDLTMAYPAVSRDFIAETLQELVTGPPVGLNLGRWGMPRDPLATAPIHPSIDFQHYLEPQDGMTPSILHLLDERPQLRLQVAKALATLLAQVRYEEWLAPESWNVERPEPWPANWDGHGIWKTPDGRPLPWAKAHMHGVPTGLGISGLLLNVALTPADHAVCKVLDSLRDEQRPPVVYLRFVDDVVILGRDPEDVGRVFAAFHDGVKPTGLKLNEEKAQPKSLSEAMKDGAWDQKLPRIPAREMLGIENVATFTTIVVREMSELGEEALDEHYGGPAFERLMKLIDLAERSEDDLEVEDDARVSFAINRISRHLWPGGAEFESDGTRITRADVKRKVLLAAAKAIRSHPWRFKLWAPMLRIAVRVHTDPADGNRVDAVQWLHEQLELMKWNRRAAEGPDRHGFRVWESLEAAEPGEDAEGDLATPDGAKPSETQAMVERQRRLANRRLRTSFHRAHFWRVWATLIRSLRAISEATNEAPPGHVTLADLLSREQAQEALVKFGSISAWALTLYGDDRGVEPGYWGHEGPFLWPWEREAIHDAVIAVTNPNALLGLKLDGRPGAFRRSLLAFDYAPLFGGARLQDLREALSSTWMTVEADRPYAPVPSPAHWLMQGEWRGADDSVGLQLVFQKQGVEPDGLARIARSGVWRRLPSLVPSFQDLPRHPVDGLIGVRARLSGYHEIRRMTLGLGRPALWGMFADWMGMGAPLPNKQATTLHETMLQLDPFVPYEAAHLPALGLPPATVSSLVALLPPSASHVLISPSTLALGEADHIALARQRRREIDPVGNAGAAISVSWPVARQLTHEPLARDSPSPHAIFLLPLVLDAPASQGHSFSASAFALYLSTGSETALDGVLAGNPVRWSHANDQSLRSRLLLNSSETRALFGGLSGRGPAADGAMPEPNETSLRYVDLGRSVVAWRRTSRPPKIETLIDKLLVRLVQLRRQMKPQAWASMADPLCEENSVFEASTKEIAARLHEARLKLRNSRAGDADGEADHIVLLPEWSLPEHELRRLARFCSETGIVVVAGLVPAETPPAVARSPRLKGKRIRCITNEAIVMVPQAALSGQRVRPGPTVMFRVRKILPNWQEVALERHLRRRTDDWWYMLAGRHTTVFTHPDWGHIGVAICSDLLDTQAWRNLQGRLHALLVPAWNKDVELFDELTRTRGYELFTHVAMANQGLDGGTLAWSPLHGSHKELFRTHGADHGVATTVTLRIQALDNAQEHGVETEISRRLAWWEGNAFPGGEFKAPPPGFRKADSKERATNGEP